MSEIVYVCARDERRFRQIGEGLPALLDRLNPGNIYPADPVVLTAGTGTIGVFNPNTALRATQTSVCLGLVASTSTDWHVRGAPAPIGTFAVFRAHENGCECLTDRLATRTVWHVLTDQLFVASTSQRLLAMILGDFEVNETALSWMIATGSLGWQNGWDRRARTLLPSQRLEFDSRTWAISIEPARASVESDSHDYDPRRFHNLLKTTIASFEIDWQHWALPLSGGVDSRGLLWEFANQPGLRSITWGEELLSRLSGSDAKIAETIAGQASSKHQYIEIKMESTDIDTVLERYVFCSEGRIDHIAAYTDGFDLWKTLVEKGISGVVRGDEVFGWVNDLASEERPRRSVGLHLISDYPNLAEVIGHHLPSTTLPPEFERRTGESLPALRDRLYREFRVPVILAALNKIKTPYVEIFSPWLAGPIVDFVTRMPDEMRTDKRAFRAFVAEQSRGVPFARSAAVGSSEDFLERPETINCLADYLAGTGTASCLPAPVMDGVLRALQSARRAPSIRRQIMRRARNVAKWYLPAQAQFWVKRRAQNRLPSEKLAFRAYLVEASTSMLSRDAAAGRAAMRNPNG